MNFQVLSISRVLKISFSRSFRTRKLKRLRTFGTILPRKLSKYLSKIQSTRFPIHSSNQKHSTIEISYPPRKGIHPRLGIFDPHWSIKAVQQPFVALSERTKIPLGYRRLSRGVIRETIGQILRCKPRLPVPLARRKDRVAEKKSISGARNGYDIVLRDITTVQWSFVQGQPGLLLDSYWFRVTLLTYFLLAIHYFLQETRASSDTGLVHAPRTREIVDRSRSRAML